MSSMLVIVQKAFKELGLTAPINVIGNLSMDAIQMLALANAAGDELAQEYDWRGLTKEYRFTTAFSTLTGTTTSGSAVITGISSTAGLTTAYMAVGTGINQDTYIQSVDSPTQVTLTQNATASGTVSINFCKTQYAVPADYDRLVENTQWDKSKHWQMLGPETPQQWQWLKSGFISSGPRIRFRLLGSTLQIWPPLSTAEYIGFEYVSNAWASDVSGAAKSSFTVDTDTCIYSDRLMVTKMKLKYFEIKGFDTTVLTRDYTRQLDISKASDKSSPLLSFAPQPSQILIGVGNIPDSGYGT